VMKRSLLSRFLVLLRKRRGYSAEYVAHKLNIPLIDYILLEESPELPPVSTLHKVLTALKISGSEYIDLCFLINSMYMRLNNSVQTRQKPAGTQDKNVLDLYASKNLNLPGIGDEEDQKC